MLLLRCTAALFGQTAEAERLFAAFWLKVVDYGRPPSIAVEQFAYFFVLRFFSISLRSYSNASLSSLFLPERFLHGAKFFL